MTLSVSDVRAVASNVFLFGLVLGMAGTIEPKAFEKRVREYRGLVMGLASQFVLLPFLGFLVVRSFKLDAVAGITLLITTTSPGGGFSGLLCSLCNADLALSVAMTTVSTVMAMFLIPLNCLIYINSLYGVSVQLPWASLCLSVSVVVAAVAVGLALSAKRPGWSSGLNRIGTACGLANIALAGLSSGGSDTPFWSHPPLFVLAIGLPCLAGLLCSFVISRHVLRIDGPQAVAICIECCYQNTALAITVALSVFRDDAGYAAGIPLIYGAIEPLVIAPFCLLAWKAGWTYGDSRLPFSQWLLNNYQPVAETNHPAYTRNVSSGEDDAAGARAAAWQAPGSRRNRSWAGSISAAVLTVLSMQTEERDFSRAALTAAGACAAHRITVTLADGARHTRPPKLRFPLNLLRNLAVRACSDPFVLMLDADLEVFPPLSASLLNRTAVQLLGPAANRTHVAIVLPAFAVHAGMLATWRQRDARGAPYAHKQQLLGLYETGLATPFNSDIYPRGERASDYAKWFARSEPEPYRVVYESGYEPYVLMRADDARATPYDTRFVGYGYDRHAHIEELHARGFALEVSPELFVVHTHEHAQVNAEHEPKEKGASGAGPGQVNISVSHATERCTGGPAWLRFRRNFVGVGCSGDFYRKLLLKYGYKLQELDHQRVLYSACYRAQQCLGGCVTRLEPELQQTPRTSLLLQGGLRTVDEFMLAVLLGMSAVVAPTTRTFFAACPRGLEPALARELAGTFVGASNIELARNGVWFDGGRKTGMAAVLWSRTANRVMELLSSARAAPTGGSPTGWFTKERLYDFARDSVDWPSLLAPEPCGVRSIEECTVACEATVGDVDRSISNSHFTALELKNALVDEFRDRTGGLRPSVDVANPHLPLQMHVHRDAAWLFRVLSPFGSLHRRGYREAMHIAVLRENLAAGLLLETGLGLETAGLDAGPAPIDPDGAVLCDPMCGSATLAVEAALIATRTAPGLLRWGDASRARPHGARAPDAPPFFFWADYDRAEWRQLLREAEAARRPLRMRIHLADAHAGALSLAHDAFERIGHGRSPITYTHASIDTYRPLEPPTLIVANPPWGRRIGGARRVAGGGVPDRSGTLERRGRRGAGELAPDERDAYGMSEGVAEGSVDMSDRPDGAGDGAGASDDDVAEAWSGLGRFAKGATSADGEGVQLWTLSGASDLTKHLRMKASRKLPIAHGGVDLRWIKYDVLPPRREWLGADGRRAFGDGGSEQPADAARRPAKGR